MQSRALERPQSGRRASKGAGERPRPVPWGAVQLWASEAGCYEAVPASFRVCHGPALGSGSSRGSGAGAGLGSGDPGQGLGRNPSGTGAHGRAEGNGDAFEDEAKGSVWVLLLLFVSDCVNV